MVDLNEKFVRDLRARCARADVFLDVYDMDFIVGAMMDWCHQNNAVFTSKGVRPQS
jgi:hypothetical protein